MARIRMRRNAFRVGDTPHSTDDRGVEVMPRTCRTALDRSHRQAHADYVTAWLADVVAVHYDEPLVVATGVAVADVYAGWVGHDPTHPVGAMPDSPFDSDEVRARLLELLGTGHLWLFPGLIEWDRPWPLRTGLAARSEAADIVRLYIGIPSPN